MEKSTKIIVFSALIWLSVVCASAILSYIAVRVFDIARLLYVCAFVLNLYIVWRIRSSPRVRRVPPKQFGE